MGATNCPETPRQKMIGMMYLVYLALLALNVSKDILDAFNVVDDTLTKSNISVTAAINSKYAALEADTTAKAKIAQEAANQLKAYSTELIDYVQGLRIDMIKYVDGEANVEQVLKETGGSIPVKDIEGKDDFDKPTYFMLEENAPNHRAKQLREKIEAYKSNILTLLPKNKEGKISPDVLEKAKKDIGLDLEGPFYNAEGAAEDWENHNFNHLVTAGSVILLSKIIGEIRTAENVVLQAITTGLETKELAFDQAVGRAIPKSQIVFSGSKYESDIVVAAFSSTEAIDVYYMMGKDSLTQNDIPNAQHLAGTGGQVHLELPAGGTGSQKFAGLIKIKGTDGEDKYFPFKDTYQVIQPSATIAADKMNVLYAGIPNPVSVAGSVDANTLSVSISGCTLKSTGVGHYDVTVPTSLIGKKVTASVTAKTGDGSKSMGSTEFRVKKVPDPTSYLGANIWGGKRSKSELMANPFISARMGEDFAYDLKWTINSYRVTFITKGIEGAPKACSGGAFSADVKSAIQSAGAGTVIIFSDIKASSIAGQRTLRDITIRIK